MLGSVLAFSAEQLRKRTLSATSSIEDAGEIEELKHPLLTEEENKGGGGLTCQVCQVGVGAEGSGFLDVAEQREHFRTDWHRYNLQRSVRHRPSVTREQFEKLLENDDVSSISGSESDPEEQDTSRRTDSTNEKTMVCFSLEDGSTFRVWRCLVQPQNEKETDDEDLRSSLCKLAELRQWVVILAKGGHFAAACFEKSATSGPKGKGPYYKVTKHKTFHRYVVRAKAGGRQSTKDATGKHARSAGASLRRHNEAALERDIGEVLSVWKPDLDDCDLIFTSIALSDVRAVFGGSSSTLNQHDPRVRKIPFATRRPTFSESKRVSDLLMATYEAPKTSVLVTPKVETIAEEEDHFPDHPDTQDVEVGPSENATLVQNPLDEETNTRGTVQGLVHPIPKSSKKKSKKKPKSKDQRRSEAMCSEHGMDGNEPQEKDDDEVERAVAAAAQHVQQLARKKKSHGNGRRSAPPTVQTAPNSLEERRELMRQAAEKRMADLQGAARGQQLW